MSYRNYVVVIPQLLLNAYIYIYIICHIEHDINFG